MTQCEKVLRYIIDFGSITQLDALREFGCMRLASRITDLKKQGWNIKTVMNYSHNRYGEPIKFAR